MKCFEDSRANEIQPSPLENISYDTGSGRAFSGFGIRDSTKIQCGNREYDKYIDGIRDLTVPREAGLAKTWGRDAGFMFACLSGMSETLMHVLPVLAAKANQPAEL